MITPGTLCLLVGYHGFAGRICVVLSGPHPDAVIGKQGEQVAGPHYMIDVGGQRFTKDGHPLAALPSNLIPITPPSVPVVERDELPETAS